MSRLAARPRTQFATLLATLFAALALTGCSSIPVAVDYQKDTDFSALTSYFLQPPAPDEDSASVYSGELVQQRIEQAMENELTAHGLTRTESQADAQLLVSYSLELKHKVDRGSSISLGSGFSTSDSGLGRSLGLGMTQSMGSDYEQSRLVIDMRDAKADHLVWRGQAERRMPEFENPDEHAAFIAETIAAILAKYPPD